MPMSSWIPPPIASLAMASRSTSATRNSACCAYVEPRTVDVHIRRLRKALNVAGNSDIIRTVRSAGYALDVNESRAA